MQSLLVGLLVGLVLAEPGDPPPPVPGNAPIPIPDALPTDPADWTVDALYERARESAAVKSKLPRPSASGSLRSGGLYV